MKKVILSLDQGTTGIRALLYDSSARLIASAYKEFHQYYPKPGWVEHDPIEIWKTTLRVIAIALKQAHLSTSQIISIGITNQRETTVLWDPRTGKPAHRAIVWQDRRTAKDCDRLRKQKKERIIRSKTGLVLDPYFSATKIQWLLNLPGMRQKAQRGQLLFGTIDSWILWNLTGGKSHATDLTNASRTLLLNIHKQKWDDELLKIFKIPRNILPELKISGELFGKTISVGPLTKGIPIHAMMGDQQAALYGQACYRAGEVKNTYGTGCFVVMNLGRKNTKVPFGLLQTLACDKKGKPVYALEGSIFIAGAAMQWLRDGLQFYKKASESEKMIQKLKDSGGVTVIPAFAGLGSPYWDAHVRGMISGITRGTTRAHIIRATLESIAHQTADVLEVMKKMSNYPIRELKVDGGVTANRFLMQCQADYLQIPICVSSIAESTAWGVAKLAGSVSGFWPSLEALDRRRVNRVYPPKRVLREVKSERDLWRGEIKRLRHY